MSVEEFRSCSSDARAHAVRGLTGRLNAIHAEIMDLLLAVDAEADWRDDGATDVAAWFEARTDVAPGTAKEWKRVAAELVDLPKLREAFREGLLSWDQIRVIVKFATPDSDEVLAVELIGCPVSQLETMAKLRRKASRRKAREAERHRRLRRRRDDELGGVFYGMFLPDEDAATFDAAVDRQADAVGPDAETGTWAPADRRCADVLVDWAARSLGADASVDLATVVVHADAAVVDGVADGAAVTGDGSGVITTEGVLRLLCESRLEYHFHDTDGSVVGVAEASRVIPAWLRRVVEHRDLHCRFPGCHRRIRHLHHIEHWVYGGHTDADNLVGLCWHHHHLVHDGHPVIGTPWSISGDPETELVFHHPDGVRTFVSTARPNQMERIRRRRRRVEPGERTVRFHTSRHRVPPAPDCGGSPLVVGSARKRPGGTG